uniref:UDP-glycosyltransferases domain-containing protein n=1 Tax=Kalanchoe fedtschenkoi TaxID=63787 RepID=A0A7N0RJB4_KALFE
MGDDKLHFVLLPFMAQGHAIPMIDIAKLFSNLTAAQMLELGLGLEASGRPFIWVVGLRNIEWKKSLQQLMVRNGYEERVSSARRGLLIWGWAPQVQILSHQAVGGFLTHCGWNSSLEGISAGIPMVTWPLFSDQFYNEKFLVDILKIGVREEEIGVQVHGDEVRNAVEELMDGGGEEGEARRRRVRELAEKARKAVEEGGSSQINIENFIEDVRKFTAKKAYA